jgi:type III pantothenate kinase
MLLAIDVGNTNVTLGLFDATSKSSRDARQRPTHVFRLESARNRTADEYAVMVVHMLALEGVDPRAIDAAIVASVVPPLTDTIVRLVERAFRIAPLVVGPGTKTGVAVLVDNPREVGADRIVNAVAAHARTAELRDATGQPLGVIVVDFGTATTFDVVSPKGDYIGGAICPGLQISADALFARAAKLPRVEVVRPPKALGKNTQQHMQSGLFFGYVGLVDGLVQRLRDEVPFPTRVLATGGLAVLIAPGSATIEEVDDDLTLDGLRIIHQRNV